MEKEQIKEWQAQRYGERILEIGISFHSFYKFNVQMFIELYI